tara:strand:+ start:52699 stop:53667 length:969 start_codon:yes stop_codon:yes gene_type:complete
LKLIVYSRKKYKMTSSIRDLLPSVKINKQSNEDYLSECFEECKKFMQENYENFTIGSKFIPKNIRKHFYSVYTFCRLTDDIGDESTGNRLENLRIWENELDKCYISKSSHPYFIALENTIKTFKIKKYLFKRIITANLMDQKKQSFQTFSDLLDYCKYSANPVGRILLQLLDCSNRNNIFLSDKICTALQITNFLQDIKRDIENNRLYIPISDLKKFHVSYKEIKEKKYSKNFKKMMQFQATRTKKIFEEGYNLINYVDKKLVLDISLFTMGGLSIISKIEKNNFDTITKRPKLSKLDKIKIFISIYLRIKFGLNPVSGKNF